MNCPKCGGCLEPIICAGIEVDRCSYCRGMWFDSLEAEQLKAIRGSEELDVGNPQMGTQLDSFSPKVECPRCGTPMIRAIDIDEYTIWYERCPNCQGVWLDAGEFKKYKRNFRGQGLLGQARRVWRRRPKQT